MHLIGLRVSNNLSKNFKFQYMGNKLKIKISNDSTGNSELDFSHWNKEYQI